MIEDVWVCVGLGAVSMGGVSVESAVQIEDDGVVIGLRWRF